MTMIRSTVTLTNGHSGSTDWEPALFFDIPFYKLVLNNARVTVEKADGTVIVYVPVDVEDDT